MTPDNHLRLFLSIFLIALLAGCRQETPGLRVEKQASDAVKTLDTSSSGGPEVIKEIGPNTQVVTGEPVMASDEKTADAQTAKDKTGAVAVKTQF